MKCLEHTTVSTLVTTMSEYHIVFRFGIEPTSRHRTGSHDESIHKYDHLPFGCTEHGTDSSHHLETAEATNHLFGWGSHGFILKKTVKCLAEYFTLMCNAYSIESCPRPNALVKWNLTEILQRGNRVLIMPVLPSRRRYPVQPPSSA